MCKNIGLIAKLEKNDLSLAFFSAKKLGRLNILISPLPSLSLLSRTLTVQKLFSSLSYTLKQCCIPEWVKQVKVYTSPSVPHFFTSFLSIPPFPS